MTRFIDTEMASAGQRQTGEDTPALVPWLGTVHTSSCHAGHEALHVVDHEIDFVFTALFRWMDRHL
jgi:hypothetical protein